jgi:hypothetical protein
MVARQYCANYGNIACGCIMCNIPGKSLGEICYPIRLADEEKCNGAITKAIEAIMKADNNESNKLLLDLKWLSLHPVPVCYFEYFYLLS